MWLSNLSQCFESQTPIVDEFFVGDLLKDTTANITTQTWGHEWYTLLSAFTSKVICPAKLPNPPPKKKKSPFSVVHSYVYSLKKKTSEGPSLLQPSPPCPSQPFRPLQVPPWWEHPYWVPTHHVRTYQKWVPWRREDHQQDFPFKRGQEMKVLALVVHFFLETCVFVGVFWGRVEVKKCEKGNSFQTL